MLFIISFLLFAGCRISWTWFNSAFWHHNIILFAMVFNAVIWALRVFFWLQIIAWICFRKPHSSTIYRVKAIYMFDMHVDIRTDTSLTGFAPLLTNKYPANKNELSECFANIKLWKRYFIMFSTCWKYYCHNIMRTLYLNVPSLFETPIFYFMRKCLLIIQT